MQDAGAPNRSRTFLPLVDRYFFEVDVSVLGTDVPLNMTDYAPIHAYLKRLRATST